MRITDVVIQWRGPQTSVRAGLGVARSIRRQAAPEIARNTIIEGIRSAGLVVKRVERIAQTVFRNGIACVRSAASDQNARTTIGENHIAAQNVAR